MPPSARYQDWLLSLSPEGSRLLAARAEAKAERRQLIQAAAAELAKGLRDELAPEVRDGQARELRFDLADRPLSPPASSPLPGRKAANWRLHSR